MTRAGFSTTSCGRARIARLGWAPHGSSRAWSHSATRWCRCCCRSPAPGTRRSTSSRAARRPVIHFFFQYWNTLPFGIGIVFLPLLVIGLWRAGRRWPWPVVACVRPSLRPLLDLHGLVHTGLMRDGLHAWTLTLCAVIACEQAASGFGWLRSTPDPGPVGVACRRGRGRGDGAHGGDTPRPDRTGLRADGCGRRGSDPRLWGGVGDPGLEGRSPCRADPCRTPVVPSGTRVASSARRRLASMSLWSRFRDLLTGRSSAGPPLPTRHQRREAARRRHQETGEALWTEDDRHLGPGGEHAVADVAPGLPATSGLSDRRGTSRAGSIRASPPHLP